MPHDAAPPPFHLSGDDSAALAVVISCPHAGRHYPAALDGLQTSLTELQTLEDPHVDLLVGPAAAHQFPVLAATYARAWIDLNRHPEEMDPSAVFPRPASTPRQASLRVASGLGLVPTRLSGGRRIHRAPLSQGDVTSRLASVHQPYHEQLMSLLEAARAEHGHAVLLDCHSMPSLPRGSGGRPGADIVLGDRFGRSAMPAITAALEKALMAHEFIVTRNHPYAGGHVVERHGSPEMGIHAIQIEIDRRLYLDPADQQPSPAARELSQRLISAFRAFRAAAACLAEDEATRLAAE